MQFIIVFFIDYGCWRNDKSEVKTDANNSKLNSEKHMTAHFYLDAI